MKYIFILAAFLAIAFTVNAEQVSQYECKIKDLQVAKDGDYLVMMGTIYGPPCDRVHVILDVVSETGAHTQIGKDNIKVVTKMYPVHFESKTRYKGFVANKGQLEISRVRAFCIEH